MKKQLILVGIAVLLITMVGLSGCQQLSGESSIKGILSHPNSYQVNTHKWYLGVEVGGATEKEHTRNFLNIRNSRGNEWPALTENIQLAIDDLGGAGDVWIPDGTYNIYNDIDLKFNGVRLHGQSTQNTVFIFSNGAKITNDYSNPLDDIELDHFRFTGYGQIWLVLKNNGYIHDIIAEDTITHRETVTIYVVAPQHGICKNLRIINCITNRTGSHGFAIHGLSDGFTFDSCVFENCVSSYAGYGDGHCFWACGFVLSEGFDGTPGGQPVRGVIKNLVVSNCHADHAFESGFHYEWAQGKYHNRFIDCTSNYNGRKLDEGGPRGYPYFCSGFLNIPWQTDVLTNCSANYNTRWGFCCAGGHLENCSATGNRVADYYGEYQVVVQDSDNNIGIDTSDQFQIKNHEKPTENHFIISTILRLLLQLLGI